LVQRETKGGGGTCVGGSGVKHGNVSKGEGDGPLKGSLIGGD